MQSRSLCSAFKRVPTRALRVIVARVVIMLVLCSLGKPLLCALGCILLELIVDIMIWPSILDPFLCSVLCLIGSTLCM